MLMTSSLFVVSNSCSRYSGMESGRSGQVCCNNKCVLGSDCLNQPCTSRFDCSVGQSCCSHKCRNSIDCKGYFCSTDSDCGSLDLSCCRGTCKHGEPCAPDPTAVIVGSVIGMIVFIFMLSAFIFFSCRQRQTIARHGGVLAATTITTTRGVSQANEPYPSQMTPSYQQAYLYYPPTPD